MELMNITDTPSLAKDKTRPRSLFEINDLSDYEIETLFSLADAYAADKAPKDCLFQRQILGSLFFQSSTRTRFGFETAAQKLGLNVVSLPNISASRSDAIHQETIQDAVRVIQGLVDIAVVRTSEERWFESIQDQLEIPIINGGDGNNQHPTQALADMWIASRLKGEMSNLRVGLVGVLGSRVHHSVIQLLCRLKPKEVGIFTEDTIDLESNLAPLKASNIQIRLYKELRELVQGSDVVEVMPLRMPDLGSTTPSAISDKSPHAILPNMFDGMKHPPLVLHPGPRSVELPDAAIALSNVPYFKQVKQAAFMKMALYHFLLQESK